ncbi:hypothetical protein KI387_008801, partial [Taxus chinensis]
RISKRQNPSFRHGRIVGCFASNSVEFQADSTTLGGGDHYSKEKFQHINLPYLKDRQCTSIMIGQDDPQGASNLECSRKMVFMPILEEEAYLGSPEDVVTMDLRSYRPREPDTP